MHNFERVSFLMIQCTALMLLCASLIFPKKLLAAEQVIAPPEEPTFMAYIDAPRDYVSRKFAGFASNMDRFFGDERNYQESNNSVLQIDLTKVAGYGGRRNIVISGRAKWHLPNTERRLHLMLETDSENRIKGEPTPGQPETIDQATAPGKVSVAARFERKQEARWHFSTDAGIQVRTPLEPFARVRGSYSVQLEKWRIKTAESLFWFNTIGAGETTQIDFERIFSEPVLLRISSNATWLHEKQNFDLRQDASIYHTLSDRSALLYQASVTGVSNPQAQITEYMILMLFRYRLHRNWVFFEISPQLHFPKDMNFKSSPTLSMRLEMLFDGSK